jgi:D-alanyl-D-alanine carboxypeptidase (penicillin-binding protein 5/6)
LAKVITALVVLNAKPISADESGPDLTITEADVARFESAKSSGQSTLEVKVGQTITERQMLEGIMLASANNLAETLALWAYDGSMENFLQTANTWLSNNGFASTHLADASGFSAESVSSANDLVGIAAKANENAALKSIFSAKTAQFPGVGGIKNTNGLLGVNGVYGLKTGHTAEAGANLLFTSEFAVKGETKIMIGVVLGQSDSGLLEVASKLNYSAQQNVGESIVLPAGSTVGEIIAPWGEKARVVLAASLTTIGWKDEVKNTAIEIEVAEEISNTVSKGKPVGKAKTTADKVDVITESAIFQPSFSWKVFHPF